METAVSTHTQSVSTASNHCVNDSANAQGFYTVTHYRDGEILSQEDFSNVVCTEGKNAMLDNALAGSSYTAVNYMGLISNVSYSTPPAATNVASNLGGTGNGWTEAGTTNAPTFAARLAPSFSAASAGSKAQSTTTNFTMTGAGTVKGCFLLVKSSAGVAPTSAALNTSGSLWSAGLFSADKVVAANDVIQVTYSTSL